MLFYFFARVRPSVLEFHMMFLNALLRSCITSEKWAYLQNICWHFHLFMGGNIHENSPETREINVLEFKVLHIVWTVI